MIQYFCVFLLLFGLFSDMHRRHGIALYAASTPFMSEAQSATLARGLYIYSARENEGTPPPYRSLGDDAKLRSPRAELDATTSHLQITGFRSSAAFVASRIPSSRRDERGSARRETVCVVPRVVYAPASLDARCDRKRSFLGTPINNQDRSRAIRKTGGNVKE